MTGFNSKREAAADKVQEPYDQTALELCNVCGWKTLIPGECCLNCERAQLTQEPVAWCWIGRKGWTEYGPIPHDTYPSKPLYAVPLPTQLAQEPVARVSGVYGGRFTYEPINRAMVLPIGMALYSSPQEKNL